MTLQLPDLFQARADLDALLKEKNNLTGDLLPRMVLDLNVKLAKVAELAGLGVWHKTEPPQTDMILPCSTCKGTGSMTGINWEDTTCRSCKGSGEAVRVNRLLEAFVEALETALSICTLIKDVEERGFVFKGAIKPLGYKSRSEDVKEQILRIQRMFHLLFEYGIDQIGIDLQRLYQHLLYLGELLNLDPDQIITAYMESIERQRQAAGV